MTKTRRTQPRQPENQDDYLELVREFPLRPIKTEAEYDRANGVLAQLLSKGERSLSSGARDYVQALTRFVRDYDDMHYRLQLASDFTSPVARLKYLLGEHGMKATDLGQIVGGRAQASLILNGKRELSKANIRALACRFKVSPSFFF